MVGKYDFGKDKGEVGAGADAFDFGGVRGVLMKFFFAVFGPATEVEVCSKFMNRVTAAAVESCIAAVVRGLGVYGWFSNRGSG